MRFEWNTPAAWNSVEGVSRPNLLHVVGHAVSLGAISGESALEWIHGLDLDAVGLADDAYGRFPFSVDEVKPFLAAAGASQPPAEAAAEMTRLLARLPEPASPVQIAYGIVDVWRHYHGLVDPDGRHGGRCSCLMNCPEMPDAIRALDEATQRYYEGHHELATPDCFGLHDEQFNASLEPLVQRCV